MNYRRGYKLTESEFAELDKDDVVLAEFVETGVEVVGQKNNLTMSLNWAIRRNGVDFYTVCIPEEPKEKERILEDYPPISLEDSE